MPFTLAAGFTPAFNGERFLFLSIGAEALPAFLVPPQLICSWAWLPRVFLPLQVSVSVWQVFFRLFADVFQADGSFSLRLLNVFIWVEEWLQRPLIGTLT